MSVIDLWCDFCKEWLLHLMAVAVIPMGLAKLTKTALALIKEQVLGGLICTQA